ncbi:MAG: hypothetical protein M3343_01660 [Actinomycetota bacterium]|nr:hypothetical protein [Actinomycetota bacterium]
MTKQTAGVLAWLALGCVVLSVGAAEAFSVAKGSGVDPFAIASLSFPVVGALIASRQPRNALGWVMLGVGVGWGFGSLLGIYSRYGLTIRPGSLPRPDIALALSEPGWIPVIGLTGTFLILLFPNGRLPSPRWRPWAWFSAIVLVLSFIAILIQPGSFTESGYPNVRNPLGVEALRPFSGLALLTIALIPISIVGCAVGLIRRFRRSRGQERLQLKWFAAAGSVVAAVYLVLMALSLPFNVTGREPPSWVEVASNIGIYAFVLIPLATAVAILRYRLYDIDLIIKRTLVYTALTATLTVAYLLAVTGLQRVLHPFTGQSELAVAGATLAVAAIFRPARVRIQAFIDRRFYRRKYDATHTLETFSARLRDEIDLDVLTRELVVLVGTVMQPAHVSVWLRKHGQ